MDLLTIGNQQLAIGNYEKGKRQLLQRRELALTYVKFRAIKRKK